MMTFDEIQLMARTIVSKQIELSAEKQLKNMYSYKKNNLRGKNGCVICIGETADGPLKIDMGKMGVNAFFGGTTGSGKTILLLTMMLGLLENYGSKELELLIHYGKDGSTYQTFRNLNNVQLLPQKSDLAEAIKRLKAEQERRDALFATFDGCYDIEDYNALSMEKLDYKLLIIDEFSHLVGHVDSIGTKTKPGLLLELTSKCRSAGIFVIIATQRKSDNLISTDVTENFGIRVALRCKEQGSSKTIINSHDACSILDSQKGRGYYQGDDLVPFQSYYISGAQLKQRVLEIERSQGE